MQWGWVDLVIMGIIGLSVITGLLRGFVKELVALCIWVLAIGFAYNYAHSFDPWLKPYITDQSVRTAVGFIIILLASLIAGAIINMFLGMILKRSGLSGTDRLLGMGFGFLRGVFIVALLLMGIQMTSLPHQQYLKDSRLSSQFTPLVSWLKTMMPTFVKQVRAADKDNNLSDIADLSSSFLSR